MFCSRRGFPSSVWAACDISLENWCFVNVGEGSDCSSLVCINVSPAINVLAQCPSRDSNCKQRSTPVKKHQKWSEWKNEREIPLFAHCLNLGMLSNRPNKLILENNLILLIIKWIMRDHVRTVSGAQRPETESSTQEEPSSSNITCFMITPLITILRWFSLFFARLLCNFLFVRGALLQLTATRVGSWETKSCKAWREYASTRLPLLEFMHHTFLLILLNFFSPATFLLLYERNLAPREPRTWRKRVANLEENIWSRWHQDKRPRCPSLPGLASPRLGGGSSWECT